MKLNKAYFEFSLVDLVEIATFCGLALVLDNFASFKIGSSGGSLNIAMVPIFVISLRHGPFKGFIAGGVVFGLLSCLIDGYGFLTYPLEYLIAFGVTCSLGFFSPYIYRNFGKGAKPTFLSYLWVIIATAFWFIIRTISASLDSVLIYKYTFIDGLKYNIAYCLPSFVGVAILLCALLMTLNYINHLRPSTFLKNMEESSDE